MASVAIAAVGVTSVTGLLSTIEERIARPMQFPWKTEKDPYWMDELHHWIMGRVWAFVRCSTLA